MKKCLAGAAFTAPLLCAVAATAGLIGTITLHPGQSKKVGRYTVVCTAKPLARTATRIVLKIGYRVKVGNTVVKCARSTPTPIPTPTPTTPTPAPTPPPAQGTRQNPYPLRTKVSVKDWDVAINNVTYDAWPQVQAANQFNDPPAPGWEDVVINVTMTYTGPATGTPWLDFVLKYVGASNVAYPTSGFEHYCGVPPSPKLNDYKTVFPSGTVTGNECFQIQTADAPSLVGFWNAIGAIGPWFAVH